MFNRKQKRIEQLERQVHAAETLIKNRDTAIVILQETSNKYQGIVSILMDRLGAGHQKISLEEIDNAKDVRVGAIVEDNHITGIELNIFDN